MYIHQVFWVGNLDGVLNTICTRTGPLANATIPLDDEDNTTTQSSIGGASLETTQPSLGEAPLETTEQPLGEAMEDFTTQSSGDMATDEPTVSGSVLNQCVIFTAMIAENVIQTELTVTNVNVLSSTQFTCVGDNSMDTRGTDVVEVIHTGKALNMHSRLL